MELHSLKKLITERHFIDLLYIIFAFFAPGYFYIFVTNKKMFYSLGFSDRIIFSIFYTTPFLFILYVTLYKSSWLKSDFEPILKDISNLESEVTEIIMECNYLGVDPATIGLTEKLEKIKLINNHHFFRLKLTALFTIFNIFITLAFTFIMNYGKEKIFDIEIFGINELLIKFYLGLLPLALIFLINWPKLFLRFKKNLS